MHLGLGYISRAYKLTIQYLLNVITQITKLYKVIPYNLYFQC